MITDVPIGLFLSGGIDSTMVAKLIGNGGNVLTKAYSAEFRNPLTSERKWAEQAADTYDIDVNYVMLNDTQAERIDRVVDVIDEPFDGGSAITSYELFRSVKGAVKVMLTGDGGDEVFGGYARYRDFARMGKWLERIRRHESRAAYLSTPNPTPKSLALDKVHQGIL